MSNRPGRVLVVDDDPAIRRLIMINLELEGFEVHGAVDGSDALERVRAVDPDVVTLDVMMPRMDGWDVAARLRADPTTSALPVVMLTARAQESDVRRGRDLGVAAYLTKPFEPGELVTTVRQLVARRIR